MLQPIIAVDDTAVEIIQIRGGEAPAIKLHHGTEVRRQYRKNGKHHPLRLVATAAEGFNQLKLLAGLLSALPGSGAGFLHQPVAHLTQVN